MSPEPYWADAQIALHLGDCVEVLTGMDAASVDAVVTDPPYGLEFMGREWDSFKPSQARIRSRADARTNPAEGKSVTVTPESYTAGQPFQLWCQRWATECLRVLKPGGHLLAFGGTRTYHRLACGIEDAGFEIRDSVADLSGYDAAGLMWIYGSGFPKSLDVSKAIDKAGGASPEIQSRVLRDARERAGLSRDQVAEAVGCTVSSVRDWEEGRRRAIGREVEHLIPSPEYRPRLADLLGYTADERQIVGVGGASRSLYESGHRGIAYGAPVTEDAARWQGWGTALKPGWEPIVVARKPLAGTVAQNVLAHGTGALNVDGCRVPTSPGDDIYAKNPHTHGGFGHGNADVYGAGTGSDYRPKDGRWPVNVLLGPEAAGELDRQSGTVKSSGVYAPVDHGPNGIAKATSFPTPGVPGSMYADSGGASRFFPVFRYEAKAAAHERPRSADGNAHPTVKPVPLKRWLARLVTPPGGLVLDPFAGSGTTGEACIVEGFRCVLIEKDPASVELIQARLRKPIQPDMFGGVA
jgi:site-specific DNA-methyltransferase (adenine-specific)